MSHHDKTRKSSCPKMVALSQSDPRMDGVEPGYIRLECDTCGFVCQIKDEYLNRYNAQKRAVKAHIPSKELAVVPHVTNQQGQQPPAGSLPPVPFPGGAHLESTSGLAPMSIEQTTTMEGARMENTRTLQHGFTMNVTEGRARMADGTIVEGSFQLDSKGSTVETQVAEYKKQVTHLQAQCKEIESARVEAVNDAREQNDKTEFFSTLVGKPILDAVVDKKSGMELMFSGLANAVLLKAVNTLIPRADFDAFCKNLPDIDLEDPFLKRSLMEEKGIEAYANLCGMKDKSLERQMPRLASVGVKPQLLRKLKLLPAVVEKPKPPPSPPKGPFVERLFWGDFKTDYAIGKLPSLLKLNRGTWYRDVQRDQMMQLIHLHLSRDDGERPTLLKIKDGGWMEERYLEENGYRATKMFIAYMCLWCDPRGVSVECRVAESLVRKCPEYAEQVRAFEATQM